MKPHHWPCIALAALLLAAPCLARAEDDQTVSAFVNSCFQYLDKPGELAARLDTSAQRLEGRHAQKFLVGRAGKAWLMPFEDRLYGFALLDQGMCTMTALSGDPKAIVSDFILLGRTAEAHSRVEWEPVSTDADWEEHAYTVPDLDTPTNLHLRMLVNTAAAAPPVRAILSVGRIPDGGP